MKAHTGYEEKRARQATEQIASDNIHLKSESHDFGVYRTREREGKSTGHVANPI